MSYTTVNYEEVESVASGLHFLRDPLATDGLGFSVLEVEDDWEGPPHDHADAGEEEVYFLVDGDGELVVEDDTIALTPGDAVHVEADATRILSLAGGSRMVIGGAP